jgi:hypothetical protein
MLTSSLKPNPCTFKSRLSAGASVNEFFYRNHSQHFEIMYAVRRQPALIKLNQFKTCSTLRTSSLTEVSHAKQ